MGPQEEVPYQQGLPRLVSVFAAGNFASAGISALGGLLVAAVVPPAVLGLFNSIGLAARYARMLSLGVVTGLNRDMPVAMGRGDHETAGALASACFGFILGIASFIGVVIASIGIVALALTGRVDLAAGWLAAAALAFLGLVEAYLTAIHRIHGTFPKIAGLRVIRSLAQVVAVLLVWLFGFYGLCLRSALSAALMTGGLWRFVPQRFKPVWNGRAVWRLMRTGVPIWGAGLLSQSWELLNVTLIVALMGPTGFGYYALARIGRTALRSLPVALQQVFQPSVAAGYGAGVPLARLFMDSVRRTFIISLCYVPVLGAAWLLLPVAVSAVLPKYAPGVEAAQWILAVVVVQSIRAPVPVLAAVAKRQFFNVSPLLIGLGAYLLALLFLCKEGIYLAAFPQACLCGEITSCVIGYALAVRFLARSAIAAP